MRHIPAWLLMLGVMGFAGATVLCAVFAYATTRQLAISAGETGIEVGMSFDLFAQNQPTATPSPTLEPSATPTLEPGITPTLAPTVDPNLPTPTLDPLAGVPELSTEGRMTILLLGMDQRSAVDTEQAYRTDTIMLVHINPASKHVGVISIPRDLFVPIPGYRDNYRINTANYLGDLNEYPGGGGPALAAETIRQNFGIKVDGYVRVNFDVFEEVVNILAPGGIEVCPTEAIYDPKYPDAGYGIIEVRFDPGCQRLDATRLLQYARTRATEGGDFDRARRQQEVLRSAQRELLSVGGIANFLTQIPTLYQQLSANVKTDLSLDEIIALGAFASTIGDDDITMAVIDNRHIAGFAKAADNADVLLPDWVAIRRLVKDTFNPQPELTLAELGERAAAENASVAVFNNTDIGGLASRTSEWLASKQITAASVGNMPTPDNGQTVIRDYTGRQWTAKYLARLFNIPEDRIEAGRDGLTSADVMVVVGPDVQSLLSREGQP